MVTLRNTKANSYTFDLSKGRTLFVLSREFIEVEDSVAKEKSIVNAIKKGILTTVLPHKEATKKVPQKKEYVKTEKKDYSKKIQGDK